MSAAVRLLEAAYSKNDCKSLRPYIKKGYDARAQNLALLSLLYLVALFRCSGCDKGSMVADLIKRGAEADAREAKGHTALMMCKSKTVATALLDHGAEVNAVNVLDKGKTSLMYAVLDNSLPLV
jgi:ankyrin repeat protein